MTKTVFSTGEAARLLNLKPHKLTYAHVNGNLREPSRIFGRRAYSKRDIERAAEYFGVRLSEQEGGEDERP